MQLHRAQHLRLFLLLVFVTGNMQCRNGRTGDSPMWLPSQREQSLGESFCLGFLWSEKCHGHLRPLAGKIIFWSKWHLGNSPIKQNPGPLLMKGAPSKKLFFTRAERLFVSNTCFGISWARRSRADRFGGLSETN